MGNYDNIQVPTGAQPISASQFGVPVRDAIIKLDARVTDIEDVPAAVADAGAGVNLITTAVNTWGDLPSFAPSVSMTNPSPTRNLICMVSFGAWMQCGAGTLRIGFAVSGGLTLSSGVGAGSGPIGWGEIPLTSTNASEQKFSMCTVTIPASGNPVPAVFKIQAYRSATGTHNVNYPTIRVTPLWYQ